MEVEIVRTRKRRSLFLATAASVALALSGCGGGGASTRPDGGATGSAGTVIDGARVDQDVAEGVKSAISDAANAMGVKLAISGAANAMGVKLAISGAANAIPRPGSVTQSSNVDANTDVTINRVEVTAEYDGFSDPSFTVANGMDWQIDASDGDPVPISDASSPWQGVGLSKKLADATLYVDVYTDIEAPAFDCEVGTHLSEGQFCSYSGAGNDFKIVVNGDGSACVVGVMCSGSVSVIQASIIQDDDFLAVKIGGTWKIYTLPTGVRPVDGTQMLDTDYLAGGVWLVVPDAVSNAADYVFGAFADGSDPFDQTILQALSGTANYEGGATSEIPSYFALGNSYSLLNI